MDIRFTGKRALVTGAAGNIGKAVTDILVKGGATVIAVDIRQDALQDLYKDCPQVIPVVCDLTNWEEAAETIAKNLPIDLLVNNAGVSIIQAFDKIDVPTMDKQFDLNIKPTINLSQVAIKDWIARKTSGAIVNMASVVAEGGVPYSGIYAASKAAVTSFTETMAVEFGKFGIRANSVRPGPVKDTPMINLVPGIDKKLQQRTPTGCLTSTTDVASAVCFLLSDYASNITGTHITVDGGITTHCM